MTSQEGSPGAEAAAAGPRPHDAAYFHDLLGDSHKGLGHAEAAIEAYRQAADGFRAQGAHCSYALCLFKIAESHLSLGEPWHAIGYLEACLPLLRDLGLTRHEGLAREQLDACQAELAGACLLGEGGPLLGRAGLYWGRAGLYWGGQAFAGGGRAFTGEGGPLLGRAGLYWGGRAFTGEGGPLLGEGGPLLGEGGPLLGRVGLYLGRGGQACCPWQSTAVPPQGSPRPRGPSRPRGPGQLGRCRRIGATRVDSRYARDRRTAALAEP
jgi:hypothetical protein